MTCRPGIARWNGRSAGRGRPEKRATGAVRGQTSGLAAAQREVAVGGEPVTASTPSAGQGGRGGEKRSAGPRREGVSGRDVAEPGGGVSTRRVAMAGRGPAGRHRRQRVRTRRGSAVARVARGSRGPRARRPRGSPGGGGDRAAKAEALDHGRRPEPGAADQVGGTGAGPLAPGRAPGGCGSPSPRRRRTASVARSSRVGHTTARPEGGAGAGGSSRIGAARPVGEGAESRVLRRLRPIGRFSAAPWPQAAEARPIQGFVSASGSRRGR